MRLLKVLLTIIADEDKDVVISTLPPAAAIDTNGANRRRLYYVSIAIFIMRDHVQ